MEGRNNMSILSDLSHIPVFLRSPGSNKTEGNLCRFFELDNTRKYDFEVVMRNSNTFAHPGLGSAQFISLFRETHDHSQVRVIRAAPSLPETAAREAPFFEADYHASFSRQATYKEGAD
jgi:hypothetical protein